MTIAWTAFAEIINAHQRFLLTSHIRPDCDALGSEIGMAHVLEAVGKDVVIVNGQATPSNIAFIDPDQRIKTIGADIQSDDLDEIEVMIVLDTSAWAQLGPMSEVLRTTKAKKLIVDHHVSGDDLGATEFKNTEAEATGRLVVEAADALGVELNVQIATPVFAALATDTGWYRFGSVRSNTYQLAARLVDAGASPADIYCDLYEQETAGRSRLRGLILSRIVTELDGRFVHTYVRKEDFQAVGAALTDTEDAINLTLAIAGTEFAVILVEQQQGGFKISFRSRCDLDGSKIAEHFGGGGHKAAAGAFVDEPFETAQRRVLDHVRNAMQ